MPDTRIFKLTSFSPIGFKIPNYPVDMCLVCRGPLTEVCMDCSEKNKEECPVVLVEETHYHRHCYQYLTSNSNSSNNSNKKAN